MAKAADRAGRSSACPLGAPHRIDLDRVEKCLRALQRDFSRINATLRSRRETLADEVVANMIAGYGAVNRLLDDDVDVFSMGHLSKLLELNAVVLCGTAPSERARFHRHLAATERHFYETVGGGIRDLMEWYERHRGEDAWSRAAGVYVRMLSEPQLFIEGNHRSGALIMSYLLVRDGLPPFVLKVDNAKAYFDPSTLIRATQKHSMEALWRLPRMKRTFARFLRANVDKRSLAAPAAV